MMDYNGHGLKLDVACGCNPRGDVNCDLHPEQTTHRGVDHPAISIRNTPNFVKCHACYLPFKTGAFAEVFCAQLIEHVPKPMALIRELSRVSNRKVVIETCHRFSEMLQRHRQTRKWNKEHHISKMDVKTLHTYAVACGLTLIHNYVITYVGFPSAHLPWIMSPEEFGMEFVKNE